MKSGLQRAVGVGCHRPWQWHIAWCLWLWPIWAWGHAGLLSSEPAAGVILSHAPADVVLRYSEPVQPLVMRLIGPQGETWDLQAVPLDVSGWRLPLPDLSTAGAYVLSWRVVSADGHPVGGTVPFSWSSAGAPLPAVATSVSTPATAWSGRMVAIWWARWLLLAGLVGGVGMAVSVWWSARAASIVRTGWPFGPVLVLAVLPMAWVLQGLDARDAPWSSAWRWTTWQAAADTTLAVALAWMAAAAMAAWLAVRVSQAAARGLAVVALVCAATALAASGHAAVAPPAWLARPVVWLHAAAAMLWAGSLWPLWRALREEPAVAQRMLARFSRVIPWVLALLVGTGVVLMALQWGGDDMPWQNAYGQVLLVKLGWVAGLLALGAWNRWRLRAGRDGDGSTTNYRAIRRVILMECVLVLAVLGTAAAWRFTPPPRVAALHERLQQAAWCSADQGPQTEASIRYAEAAIPGMAVELAWWQPAAAPGEIELFLSDGERMPMSAQAVRLVFEDPSGQMEPVRFDAQSGQDGLWRADGVLLPALPAWRMHVDVLVTDFDRWRATVSW